MTKTVLVFSQSATGHYLEYLHHLYIEAGQHSDVEYVFCVPDNFTQEKHLWEWPEKKNICFDLISATDCSYQGGYLRRNFRFASTLQKFIKKHHPQNIFLLDLMLCMPWLALMPCGAVHISGIIYAIDYYRRDNLSLGKRLFSHWMNWLLAKRSPFSRLFLLNAIAEARYYNKIYSTDHFFSIPDPFCEHKGEYEDYRKKYSIPVDKKIFLHFGAMGKKKGTFFILDSISKMNNQELDSYYFIFAGRIRQAEITEFYKYQNQIPCNAHILIFNKYCSYSFLKNWCACCDAILAPYITTYASSGMLGYASFFGKPLLIVNHGFLPKLIRKYQLGITIPSVTSRYFRQGLRKVTEIEKISRKYIEINDVKTFVLHLFVEDALL